MILRVTTRSLALLLGAGAVAAAGPGLRGRRRASLFKSAGPASADDAAVAAKPMLRSGRTAAPMRVSAPTLVSAPTRVSAPTLVSADASGDEDEGMEDEVESFDEEDEDESYVEEEEEAEKEEKEEEEEVEEEVPVVVEDALADAALTPSLRLDKLSYLEGEPIAVSFSVGAPSSPYYASAEAPSRKVNWDLPGWSVGLFMRDADPQGGKLAPLVRVSVCAALADRCDEADAEPLAYRELQDLQVDFGGAWRHLMAGTWPLEVSAYGTGFDAFVLDAQGAAAVGPLQFEVHTEEGGALEGAGPARYQPDGALADEVAAKPAHHHGVAAPPHNMLHKYHHQGTKAKAVGKAAASAPAAREAAPIRAAPAAELMATGSLSADKGEYAWDESLTLHFSMPTDDLSGYRVGLFMRMADPQGGGLAPIVSKPLCEARGCAASGSVTFEYEMGKDTWPLNLLEWGTGYDAYVLDADGAEVVGPVMFNVLMDDTY